jgi:hypothetical protein
MLAFEPKGLGVRLRFVYVAPVPSTGCYDRPSRKEREEATIHRPCTAKGRLDQFYGCGEFLPDEGKVESRQGLLLLDLHAVVLGNIATGFLSFGCVFWAVVCPQAYRSLCLFLRIWLLEESADPLIPVSEPGLHPGGWVPPAPSLVILPLSMVDEIVLSLKPLCTFDAVPLAQAGKILCGLQRLVLGEMFCGAQVGVDLIEVPVPDMKTRPLPCTRRADALLSGTTYLVLRLVLVLVFLIGPMTECGRLQWWER